MPDPMTIGAAARLTRTRSETIRYYEKIGLLPRPARSFSNYRHYSADDVARLGFVRRARELGFPIEQVRELLALADQRERACTDVDELTRQHIATIEQRISDLRALNRELKTLLGACRGGTVAQCRIVEALLPGERRASAASGHLE